MAEPVTLMKSRRRIAFPRLRTTLTTLDYSRVLRPVERGSTDRLHASNPELLMSAVGQKQTLRQSNGMSALPPKADITYRDSDVRFVP
jgi:hypothetical protein